ncbi:hypothetical protein A2833_02005 [Candidatus Azambacteria bacterium RIFCSPHIGHO2_01_FULL_44_55]|uniref:Uncharacterized protein n=1 Tax=Candidatus Azambacteria bacterium RIFCSPLOWO2_02_FULL_44_14 TaxID=1797306 RepID=A0A1F5CAT6_9BACT|nr:MAG: hypothetical protein A3A18_01120 [Candidatus Azambacteria bacterium RIFCSPLOWO2_01_FULL_44_84]OGD33462.1 MAG: hypothetical protein A3C78_00035 [Candidatus Azambacteria bacterium RIFCSPHIGHO2_02_FULL_45_18]OGD39689.1 MAG: hypothetical protein A2833_02005 [Candidatus Azambacteria bacterium RIFCSPHIGHO2_01_FULL_44_55]OGD39974.1 MAG: hypothetical protein A3I30_02090 [Candidatus Azambacteria bacterium RIFCSPLOWO2_02_FULL_44_14]
MLLVKIKNSKINPFNKLRIDTEQSRSIKMQNDNLKFKIITGGVIVFAFAFLIFNWKFSDSINSDLQTADAAALENIVLPSEGVVLPVRWGDLGRRMTESGVIDSDKFSALYAGRGGLDKETEKLLAGSNNGNLEITRQNSGIILNLLWALGLSNKNPILEIGPMVKYNGDASGFASTGGWNLARGDPMDHYSRHNFLALTSEQQALVERVSKNIYRPCCGNPTYFPDCNHGMAMLGLLELLAAQGVSESEMYKIALQVNSYWFPDTYLTLAKYFQTKGIGWQDVNPQEVLGRDYSSASGYQNILRQVAPVNNQNPSCGV